MTYRHTVHMLYVLKMTKYATNFFKVLYHYCSRDLWIHAKACQIKNSKFVFSPPCVFTSVRQNSTSVLAPSLLYSSQVDFSFILTIIYFHLLPPWFLLLLSHSCTAVFYLPSICLIWDPTARTRTSTWLSWAHVFFWVFFPPYELKRRINHTVLKSY